MHTLQHRICLVYMSGLATLCLYLDKTSSYEAEQRHNIAYKDSCCNFEGSYHAMHHHQATAYTNF